MLCFGLHFNFILFHFNTKTPLAKKKKNYRHEINMYLHVDFSYVYFYIDIYIAYIFFVYRMSQKKVTDLIKASVKNRACINRKSSLNYSLTINSKIGTLFVDIGTLRVDIFTLKVQIFLHLETRAFTLWPKVQTR